jgi:hypothetical protein
MTHAIDNTGRKRIPVLVIAFFGLIPLGSTSYASVPSQAVIHAGETTAHTERAKRAVKPPRGGVVKAVPQRVSPTVAAPVMAAAPAVLAEKTSVAASDDGASAVLTPAPADVPQGNPYLVNQVQVDIPPANPYSAPGGPSPLAGGGFKLAMPRLPLFEQSILPKVQTVYPTGEKPLVVVSFKCPTELVGIDTPSTLILHKVVNGGMDLINKTNLLSFNMQQVCQ